jgi:hypothetical protein
MKAALLFATGVLVAPAGGAHVPTYSCTDTYYGEYKPRVPRSLGEVDPSARARLEEYLQNRVGRELAAKLRLVGGSIVDRDQLRRENPASVNYQWRPPKYDLKFSFPLGTDDGSFCASVSMDEDGSIVKELTLPNFQRHPQRRIVATAVETAAIARKAGVPEQASRELVYFRDSDTLEWVYSFVKSQDETTIKFAHFHILAHDPTRTHWVESMGIK